MSDRKTALCPVCSDPVSDPTRSSLEGRPAHNPCFDKQRGRRHRPDGDLGTRLRGSVPPAERVKPHLRARGWVKRRGRWVQDVLVKP